MNEKVSILQLQNLLDEISQRLGDIRRRIQTKELSGSTYIPNQPYSSHFHFNSELEEFLKTLELNFFITKYNDISDKDGVQSSIYAINYGLSRRLNIPWGKPEGNKHRKYFIERPFNFNKLIIGFLKESKRIKCSNPECAKEFSTDDLKFLEFTNFNCNNCSSKVVVHSISDSIKLKLESIDDEKLLPTPELKIIQELIKAESPLFAKEIAGEIDYSGQLIGWRGRKLDKNHGYVIRTRERDGAPFRYQLTDEGKSYFN